MKQLLLMMMAVVLVGCETWPSHLGLIQGMSDDSPMMESYMGQSSADVIRRFGAAEKVQDDGQGGKILVYRRTGKLKFGNYTFFVNSNGKVYYWKWSDNRPGVLPKYQGESRDSYLAR